MHDEWSAAEQRAVPRFPWPSSMPPTTPSVMLAPARRLKPAHRDRGSPQSHHGAGHCSGEYRPAGPNQLVLTVHPELTSYTDDPALHRHRVRAQLQPIRVIPGAATTLNHRGLTASMPRRDSPGRQLICWQYSSTPRFHRLPGMPHKPVTPKHTPRVYLHMPTIRRTCPQHRPPAAGLLGSIEQERGSYNGNLDDLPILVCLDEPCSTNMHSRSLNSPRRLGPINCQGNNPM